MSKQLLFPSECSHEVMCPLGVNEDGSPLTSTVFIRASRPRRCVHRGSRVFMWSSIAAASTTFVFFLWVVLTIGGPRTADAVDDLGELGAALVAAGACAVAARKVATNPRRWVWLAASAFAWGVGEGVWSYYDLVKGVQVPFPSFADIGFLASVPLAVVGLMLFPSSPRRAVERFRGVLDGTIIAGSLLFASWATVLGPLYRANSGGAFKQAISLAYPASDVVMVSICVILFSRARHRSRGSLLLVMAGIVSFAIADSAFAYMTEVNDYGAGTFLDTGWVAGYLLIALGAIRGIYTPSVPKARHEDPVLSLVAPYVPVLAVLAVTAVHLLRGNHLDTTSWVMAFGLALLVLGRHLAVLTSRRTEVPDPLALHDLYAAELHLDVRAGRGSR